MEEKIQEILASVGFTKNEQRVYLDLIRQKKSSALDIAKRTKIHRTNVYDAVHTLQAKGFVEETVESKGRYFIARKPEALVDYLLQKKQEAEEIIPHLRALSRQNSDEEAVTMLQGAFALREELLGLLELQSSINVFGAPKEAPNVFGIGFLAEFHKKRIKCKVVMRHIYNENAQERIAQLNRMPYTRARYLPKKYESVVTTAVCGDMVLLIIFTEPLSIISIKNKKIANAYNNYFDILWKNSLL